MRGTWALLKVTINLNFGWSWMRETYLRARRRLWEPLLVLAALAVAAPPFLYLYLRLLNALYDQAAALGQPALLLGLAVLMGQFFVLIFAFFWVVSAFYFAEDLALLAPLPLRPRAVLGAKFLQISLNELLTMAFFVLPAFIVYAARHGVGFWYWPTAFIVFLLLPVVPLAVAALFAVPFMRFANIGRSRDLLTLLAGFLAVALAVLIQFFTARVPEGREEEYLRRVLAANEGLLRALGHRFPPGFWAAKALADHGTPEGLGYLLLLLFVCAALVGGMLFLAEKVFYGGLLAEGTYTRKARLRTVDLETVRAGSAVAALARREWLLLVRTPVFLMQWATSVFIFPFCLLVWRWSGSGAVPLAFLLGKAPTPVLVLGSAAALIMAATFTQLAPTAFSRAGRYFWLDKVIPVSARHQVRARQIQIWGAVFVSLLPMAAVLAYLVGFRPEVVLPGFLLGLLGSYPLLNAGLILDLRWPKLAWTHPQQAMKGNLNVLVAILVAAVYLAGLGVLAAWLFRGGWPAWGVYALLGGVAAILGLAAGKALHGMAEERFRAIED
ncbi:MAG: putative ABC transporter permease subunit [Bacillota bacterium]